MDSKFILIDEFFTIADDLQGMPPGTMPEMERALVDLVIGHREELVRIARSPQSQREAQVANWMFDLASLPTTSNLRSELKFLIVTFSLMPRPRGEPLLGLEVGKSSPSLRVID